MRLRMTGDRATDVSDASGTLWLDVAARRWSSELLAASGLRESAMPTLHEGREATGLLRAEVARDWGMERVPVAAGAGECAAEAIALGALRPEHAFLSLGERATLFAPTEGFRPNAAGAVHAGCHALPDRWQHSATLPGAAGALRWVTRLVGFEDEADALSAAEDPTEVLFLPFLQGASADPSARGVFFGMGEETMPGDLVRAVVEGIAFALADGLDALRAAGSDLRALWLVGDTARPPLWGRILADAMECRLVYCGSRPAGAAMGAARLARLALSPQPAERVCVPPPARAEVEPDPSERLRARRACFQALCRDLRPRFAELA